MKTMKDIKKNSRQFTPLSNKVIGCAIEVHRHLGPGLLESTYQKCLAHEFDISGIAYEQEYPLPVLYKDIQLDCGYRIDIFVEKEIIIELKSVDNLLPIHEAQLLTYLKLANVKQGFLINFNVTQLKKGLKSYVL